MDQKSKFERAALLEKQIALMRGLPFLHGWKWYEWARDFFESTNKITLLTAANQISKSSTQIRKVIDWATNTPKWPELWRTKPTQFWYLYPTANQATIEFEKKWVLFLPRGEYKSHPQYGWRAVYKNKEIHAIHFNTGVTIYFKSYAQDAAALQTGTVDYIAADEELPTELYDELMHRISASDGYFSMVFTATLGQDFWRLAMEPEPFEKESLQGAWKRTVSMYDCQKYEDGTLSHWTNEKIQVVKNRCKNDKEILRRVYGRFIRDDGGLKYEQFSIARHMVPRLPIPEDWLIYAGVDIGSGGKENHPAAIAFVAVRPDYRKGLVFLGWRGDGIITTSGDILGKFQQMRDQNKLTLTGQYYDWGAKDFETIASRVGEPFLMANKGHALGEDVINTLFKNDMLHIEDNDELQKLAGELVTLRKDQPKNKAADDLTDAVRYAITSIPWDFEAITAQSAFFVNDPKPQKTPMEMQIEERRERFQPSDSPEEFSPEADIAFWNEAYGE